MGPIATHDRVDGPRRLARARCSQHVSSEFAALFGHEAEGIWAAPGRLNLIGEFTDYNEGFVLPMALEQVTTAAVARRADGLFGLHSANLDDATQPRRFELAALEPGVGRNWSAYALGVAWAMRDAGFEIGGVDVLIDSNAPTGAGLSSSAALECSLALALRDLYAPDIARSQLALLCQRAENVFVGVPSGIMDQTASLCCTSGHAIVFDTRSGQIEQVPFDLAAAGLELLVIDTRVRHEL